MKSTTNLKYRRRPPGPVQIAFPRISMQAFARRRNFRLAHFRRGGRPSHGQGACESSHGRRAGAIETIPRPPNLILLEAGQDRAKLHADLDELSRVLRFAGTKVIVVGPQTTFRLYRELMSRGISEYLVMPFDVPISSVMFRLYNGDGAEPLGRVLAFVGAKGGVGSSTVAHNVAWSIAREHEVQTVIVDMDLSPRHGGPRFQPGSAGA